MIAILHGGPFHGGRRTLPKLTDNQPPTVVLLKMKQTARRGVAVPTWTVLPWAARYEFTGTNSPTVATYTYKGIEPYDPTALLSPFAQWMLARRQEFDCIVTAGLSDDVEDTVRLFLKETFTMMKQGWDPTRNG
jgi:hypothetical protein